MKTMLMVGGNFDAAGGRPSRIMTKIFNETLYRDDVQVDIYNGGFVDELRHNILPQAANYDIVLWGPNVPNTEEKVRNVKEINPKAILISTKRNNGEYDFGELISRALAQKSNLVLEFSQDKTGEIPNGIYSMRVFDPLGNLFFSGTSIPIMTSILLNRTMELTEFTRIGSSPADGKSPKVPNEKEFFAFARSCSDIFHNLINPSAGTTRFLGNMSFRCQNGFPSFRGKDNTIYVSRRNVDKRFIDADSFVPTAMAEDGSVKYYGENKPSVDTPVQQRLYQMFPQMNYMIHAHCYFDTPLKTEHPVPCGAIEEVDEIVKAVDNAYTLSDLKAAKFIAINLTGHGCLLMASDVKEFTRLMDEKDNHFVKRPAPEDFTESAYLAARQIDIENEELCRD